MPTARYTKTVMINAYLITGSTYPFRREIKSLGGKWSSENKGWLVPTEQENAARTIAEAHSLSIEMIETDPINLTTPTGERLRAIRQIKMNKKADRLEAQASRLYKQSKEMQSKMEGYHGDIAFFTQPASPSSPFGRQRKRILDSWWNGIGVGIEADKLQEKAEELRNTPARIKGDAERKRQAEREALDKIVFVGSRVDTWIWGAGKVLKVNKKTYTVKFDRCQNPFPIEKTHVKGLIQEGGEK